MGTYALLGALANRGGCVCQPIAASDTELYNGIFGKADNSDDDAGAIADDDSGDGAATIEDDDTAVKDGAAVEDADKSEKDANLADTMDGGHPEDNAGSEHPAKNKYHRVADSESVCKCGKGASTDQRVVNRVNGCGTKLEKATHNFKYCFTVLLFVFVLSFAPPCLLYPIPSR